MELVSPNGQVIETLARSSDGKFTGSLDLDVLPLNFLFRLDGCRDLPDPFATFLPDGVHGHCEISNERFDWNDQNWHGMPIDELIIYELHVGTFTKTGTLNSALEHLDYIVDLGVNAIELLPLAQCPGKWNWGL